MKKTALFLVSLLLVLGGAEAQNGTSGGRFEWVRGYAPGENVSIVGSVTDSLGNLYILGSFNFESRWEEGDLLLPVTPHGQASNNGDVLIAKISPGGEMVWKKVIHGNAFSRIPHDIKAVGDTAFACLVTMPLACDGGYLYYLDTLVNDSYTLWDQNPTDTLVWPDYPMSAWRISAKCLALITFDFDGNVLEQHFLQMSYLDRHGEDIIYHVPPEYGADDKLCTEVPEYPSFAIDGEGNIYLSRYVNDRTVAGPFSEEGEYRLTEGNISAVKFWCDRRLVGVVPADSVQAGSPQIFKFAPHFDTLLDSRYLFSSKNVEMSVYSHFFIDNYDRLYLNSELHPGFRGLYKRGIVIIDSVQGFSFYIDADKNDWKSIVVRFDSTLNATRLVSLEDSIIDSARYMGIYCFNDIAFDNDSGLIVISLWPCRNAFGYPQNNYSYFMYDGIQTSININSSILILDKETMNLKSYGQLNSPYCSRIVQPLKPIGNLSCAYNRIFFQSDFSGNIRYPNQTLQAPDISIPGFCLNIFDYKGDMIDGIDYHSYSNNNKPGPIQICDSVLYLCSQLASDATFGDIHVPSRGDYFACIAKYVDTAFMTPYVAPAPNPEGISEADTLMFNSYPNPVRDMLHIAIDDPVIHATAISLTGVRRQVPAKGNTLDLEALQPGIYILEIATMNHKYHHKIIKL